MPSPSSSPSPPGSGDAVASETVGLVIAWYQERIMAERRSPAGGPERLERLIVQHRECVRDLERLEDAAPGEVARITALYATRLKELDAGGS
ncbi:hypothetical protein [Streptomyces sp. NPDC020141]|uniref:hypothetical protein n=1 Tax=Streptomyces sp. NPDC020141 TaxID=3365065 RepID=UPI003794ACC4